MHIFQVRKQVQDLLLFSTQSVFNICVTVRYKSIPGDDFAGLLIENLEIHRATGFNKVFIYDTHNVSTKVKDVLHYYQKEGFVELVPWELPMPSADISAYPDSCECLEREEVFLCVY